VLLLLEPFAPYFAARGTPLEAISEGPDGLHSVMLTVADPNESTPPQMVERLELLDLLCDPAGIAVLEDANDAAVTALQHPDDGPEDVAARIIVHAPHIAWREFDRQAIRARRTFHSFTVGADMIPSPADARAIASLERVMRPWFERTRRSDTCSVHVRQSPGSTSFVIRHGEALRRMNVIAQDGSRHFQMLRPERVDVVSFREATGEWFISGSGRRIQEMYRQAFGLVFHGSPGALRALRRYSLEPLRRGPSVLWCGTGNEVQSATLTHVRIQLPHGGRLSISGPAAFKLLSGMDSSALERSDLLEARLDLRTAASRRLVPVVLRPSGSRPTGLHHSEAIDRWLAERGFTISPDTHETLVLESA
jgi:hypothetical protein